jgi:hypothetical protein
VRSASASKRCSRRPDDLTQKQLTLDGLAGKLSQLEDLAKKNVWQMDTLRQSRHDRCAAQGHGTSTRRMGAVKLPTARFRRTALDVFAEKMTGFSRERRNWKRTRRDCGEAEAGRRKGGESDPPPRIGRRADAHIARMSARVPFVETRGAHQRAGTRRRLTWIELAEQLTRRNELDALRVVCEGLGTPARGF